MSKTTQAQGSWFEALTQKANNIIESFDFSYDNLVKMATYLGTGFGIGFVLKRYGTFLLFGIVIAGIALYGLHSFDFMTINIEKLKSFLGFTNNATLHDVTNLYWGWIKQHISLSVSFCIGFIFGYRLG